MLGLSLIFVHAIQQNKEKIKSAYEQNIDLQKFNLKTPQHKQNCYIFISLCSTLHRRVQNNHGIVTLGTRNNQLSAKGIC